MPTKSKPRWSRKSLMDRQPPKEKIVFYEKEICVISDVLANSGGVTVSYFERCQNLIREQLPPKKVNRKLKTNSHNLQRCSRDC
ncbi:MAG TPA: hypothetical protein VMW84_02100 [Acidobacteriota bacterium]|nr:hypothetical protein [Acidobacteriota bacterium]